MRQLCYTSATQLVSDNSTEELWGNESIVGEIFCYTLLGQCYNYYYFFISSSIQQDRLNATWAVKNGDVVTCVFWEDFTTLFSAGILDVLACSKSMRALSEPWYNFSNTVNRVVVGEWVEPFKPSFGLWICHTQLTQLSLGIYLTVLFVWNFGCTVICHYSCFWIVCSNNLKFQRIILFY